MSESINDENSCSTPNESCTLFERNDCCESNENTTEYENTNTDSTNDICNTQFTTSFIEKVDNKITNEFHTNLEAFTMTTSSLLKGDLSVLNDWVVITSECLSKNVKHPQEVIQRGALLISAVVKLETISNTQTENIQMINCNSHVELMKYSRIFLSGCLASYDGILSASGVAILLYELFPATVLNIYIHKAYILLITLSMLGMCTSNFMIIMYSTLGCLLHKSNINKCIVYLAMLVLSFSLEEIPQSILWGTCGYAIINSN